MKILNNLMMSLEDPNRPLLGPNYWILTRIGLILLGNRFVKAMYICIHEAVTFFIITQYIELFLIGSDLDLILTNLKISMLSTICVMKSNTFVFWQNDWKKVVDYVTDADKYEREHYHPITEKIIGSYTKYSRRITYFYWFLVFTTFVTVTHTPLFHYISSPIYRERLRNGTEPFPHIFSAWVPYDKYQSPGSWITVVWHTLCCLYGAIIMGAYDTCAIVMILFFGEKLRLLRVRSRQMLDRKDMNDEQFAKVIKQLHDIHVLLIQNSRLLNSLLSPVMLLYVAMCSLMLCASTYQFTSATSTTQKLLSLEYIIFGILQLFLFTWHSNDSIRKSKDLCLGPYESKWWSVDVRRRKSILLLCGQFRVNYVFKAGPFTDITLSMFIKILKGAYSYYTLLRK